MERGLPAPVCRLVSSYFADCLMLSEVLDRKTPERGKKLERVVVWLRGLGMVPGVVIYTHVTGYGCRPRWGGYKYKNSGHSHTRDVLSCVVLANFSSAFNETRLALKLNPPEDLTWSDTVPKAFKSTCCFHYLTQVDPPKDWKPEISNEQQKEIDKLKQQDPALRAALEEIVRSRIQKAREA